DRVAVAVGESCGPDHVERGALAEVAAWAPRDTARERLGSLVLPRKEVHAGLRDGVQASQVVAVEDRLRTVDLSEGAQGVDRAALEHAASERRPRAPRGAVGEQRERLGGVAVQRLAQGARLEEQEPG